MTRLRFAFSFFVAALALIGPAALAGTNRWTASGPGTAAITQIVTDPADNAVAYAVTDGAGVFKTSNGGEDWRAVGEGLPRFVTGLFVLPDDPTAIYAAAGSSIFSSSDAS